MTRFLLGLLTTTASLVFVVGCKSEPELNTIEDVQKASEGKKAVVPERSMEPVGQQDPAERERIRKAMEESGGIRMPPGKGKSKDESDTTDS